MHSNVLILFLIIMNTIPEHVNADIFYLPTKALLHKELFSVYMCIPIVIVGRSAVKKIIPLVLCWILLHLINNLL